MPTTAWGSVDEILAAATDVEPMDTVGVSGSRLERIRVDGRRLVVKRLDPRTDWTMRALGDLGCYTLQLWEGGLLDRLPSSFVQPIVAAGPDPGRPQGSRRVVLVMEDIGRWLVADGDEPISEELNTRFLTHMAELQAAFWDAGPELEVTPPLHRYLVLSPWTALAEASLGAEHAVPALIGRGWDELAEVAPRAAEVVVPLAWDPGRLVTALEETPQTFLHGDWKLFNLGSDGAGRTILLDWEMPGRGPGAAEVAWYLAINCRRLPVGKETCLEIYRKALESLGVDTEPWWERQAGLALLGGLVQFGWEKALSGYDDELAWWEEAAIRGARWLP
jgi:hypothetical protein